MEKYILNYISKLEGYKIAIKGLHWGSKNMSMHKQMDEIADMVFDAEDEIAEIAQGIYDKKIEPQQVKAKRYNVDTPQQLLKDLLKDTKTFYSNIKGSKFVGLRSVVEAFIGNINKQQYLIKFVMKEDLIKRVQNKINESNDKIYLRKMIRESIKNVIDKMPICESQNNIYAKAESLGIIHGQASRPYNEQGDFLKIIRGNKDNYFHLCIGNSKIGTRPAYNQFKEAMRGGGTYTTREEALADMIRVVEYYRLY